MNRVELLPQEIKALHKFLDTSRPNTSLEIGRYRNGSLEIIAKYSKFTYSIDPVPPPYRVPLTSQIIGTSPEEVYNLPEITIDFAFIDGDHSTQAVSQDIEAVLSLGPKHIILHDSFMPSVREAIETYEWNNYTPEIDWVPGIVVKHPMGRAEVGTKAFGLCLVSRNDTMPCVV